MHMGNLLGRRSAATPRDCNIVPLKPLLEASVSPSKSTNSSSSSSSPSTLNSSKSRFGGKDRETDNTSDDFEMNSFSTARLLPPPAPALALAAIIDLDSSSSSSSFSYLSSCGLCGGGGVASDDYDAPFSLAGGILYPTAPGPAFCHICQPRFLCGNCFTFCFECSQSTCSACLLSCDHCDAPSCCERIVKCQSCGDSSCKSPECNFTCDSCLDLLCLCRFDEISYCEGGCTGSLCKNCVKDIKINHSLHNSYQNPRILCSKCSSRTSNKNSISSSSSSSKASSTASPF